jgi:hypothetical protein
MKFERRHSPLIVFADNDRRSAFITRLRCNIATGDGTFAFPLAPPLVLACVGDARLEELTNLQLQIVCVVMLICDVRATEIDARLVQ